MRHGRINKNLGFIKLLFFFVGFHFLGVRCISSPRSVSSMDGCVHTPSRETRRVGFNEFNLYWLLRWQFSFWLLCWNFCSVIILLLFFTTNSCGKIFSARPRNAFSIIFKLVYHISFFCFVLTFFFFTTYSRRFAATWRCDIITHVSRHLLLSQDNITRSIITSIVLSLWHIFDFLDA